MHRPIIWGAVVLAIVSAVLLPSARFDADPDKLKDPESELVTALADLRELEVGATTFVNVLVEDLGSAEALAQRASQLNAVGGVRTLADFLPGGQAEKAEIVEFLAFVLSPALTEATQAPPSAAELKAALGEFERKLGALKLSQDEDTAAAAERLRLALAHWRDESGDETALKQLQFRLMAGFPGRMTALRELLGATPFDLEDLPHEVRVRWVAESGVARVEIYPKERIELDDEALQQFVKEVRTVAPEAIGEPVILVETERTVIGAFVKAAMIAVVAIAVLLSVLIRNLRDVALIFAPLILAALLTVAVTVIINLPFNLANIIALPLLFGLGVAGSLQLVMRERTVGEFGGRVEFEHTQSGAVQRLDDNWFVRNAGAIKSPGHRKHGIAAGNRHHPFSRVYAHCHAGAHGGLRPHWTVNGAPKLFGQQLLGQPGIIRPTRCRLSRSTRPSIHRGRLCVERGCIRSAGWPFH